MFPLDLIYQLIYYHSTNHYNRRTNRSHEPYYSDRSICTPIRCVAGMQLVRHSSNKCARNTCDWHSNLFLNTSGLWGPKKIQICH